MVISHWIQISNVIKCLSVSYSKSLIRIECSVVRLLNEILQLIHLLSKHFYVFISKHGLLPDNNSFEEQIIQLNEL